MTRGWARSGPERQSAGRERPRFGDFCVLLPNLMRCNGGHCLQFCSHIRLSVISRPMMLRNRIKTGFLLNGITALALGLALFGELSAAKADEATSSIADRQRFLSIAQKLEKSPLDRSLHADRAWAMTWLIDAPDVSVTVCADALGGRSEFNYAYFQEILTQYSYSMAASVIEHPEMSKEPVALQIAGLEGAVSAYSAILRSKPRAHSAHLDKMIELQKRNELPQFASKALTTCLAAGSATMGDQP